jgi:hypothetical protein
MTTQINNTGYFQVTEEQAKQIRIKLAQICEDKKDFSHPSYGLK